MKRILFVLKCVLFGFIALHPLGCSLLLHFGYKLTLFSAPAFMIAIAALSVCIVVLDFIYKDTIPNKIMCVLMGMVTPLSLINIFFYILEYGQVSVLVSGMVCFLCCCILTVKHAKPLAHKIVALVLSALLALPIGLFSLLVVFFPIGQNTVVQTLESPTGRYYAELINSNQGALGGETVVYVYERWEIDLLLFKIEKEPQQVYFGEWYEFENMKIHWKDDRCIVINSVEYGIK